MITNQFIKIGGQKIDVNRLLCYVGILYLMSVFYRCIKRSEFGVVEGESSPVMKRTCYGQPGQFRGNLPGAYSDIPKDEISDRYVNRLTREGGEDRF